MTATDLLQKYSLHPNIGAIKTLLKDLSLRHIYCKGLYASSSSLFFSSLAGSAHTFLFILNDLEEAGYFYHDMTQLLGMERILFFPSSFRRAVKYRQKDAANEILRTEVLSRLQKGEQGLCIVTYPDAMAEKVVSKQKLNERTLQLHVGEHVNTAFIMDILREYDFEYTDYVYEPGQYAVRGSIIDIFSFSSEYPYRIDFFGDEVDSIRSFEIETQLSKERKDSISIVPDLAKTEMGNISFFDFIPADTVLAICDFFWVRERIDIINDEIASFSPKEELIETYKPELITGSDFAVRTLDFRRIEFGSKPTGTPEATIFFSIHRQPVYHKNFDLVAESFTNYLKQGYTIYLCSDSVKQIDRIRTIFEDRGDSIPFTAMDKTLHEGFADEIWKIALFTDHQLFDRFHKYNLKSDKA
ncbi:Transcription-repair-coupling factor, partial [termite gut metagenome]